MIRSLIICLVPWSAKNRHENNNRFSEWFVQDPIILIHWLNGGTFKFKGHLYCAPNLKCSDSSSATKVSLCRLNAVWLK